MKLQIPLENYVFIEKQAKMSKQTMKVSHLIGCSLRQAFFIIFEKTQARKNLDSSFLASKLNELVVTNYTHYHKSVKKSLVYVHIMDFYLNALKAT